MEKINIGIEISPLLQDKYTGISFYTYNLINNLLKYHKNEINLTLWNKLTKRKKLKNTPIEFRKFIKYYLPNLLLGKKSSIIHFPDIKITNVKRVRKVITVHDLAVLLEYGKIPGFTTQKTIKNFRKNLSYSLKHVDFVITISNSTKQDLIKLFDYPSEKIKTIYLAPNLTGKEQKPTANLPPEYLLYVGTISIRKNIPNLLEAYAYANIDIPLVLAGTFAPEYPESNLLNLVKKLGLKNKIIVLNYVSEGEKIYLYKNCRAFLFPTIYEGFGLPILEAMSFGKPVLIGDKGSASEIAGSYAIKCNPLNIDSIKAGILELLNANFNPEDLKKYANNFTWKKTVAETFQLYKELL